MVVECAETETARGELVGIGFCDMDGIDDVEVCLGVEHEAIYVKGASDGQEAGCGKWDEGPGDVEVLDGVSCVDGKRLDSLNRPSR